MYVLYIFEHRALKTILQGPHNLCFWKWEKGGLMFSCPLKNYGQNTGLPVCAWFSHIPDQITVCVSVQTFHLLESSALSRFNVRMDSEKNEIRGGGGREYDCPGLPQTFPYHAKQNLSRFKSFILEKLEKFVEGAAQTTWASRFIYVPG